MGRRNLRIGTLSLLMLGLAASEPARPTIHGGFGVELDGYSFSRTTLSSGVRMDDATRSLTSPYVDLWVKGPLVNPRVAHLSLGGRLSGAYHRSTNQGDKTSGRNKPELTRYDARLSLFGTRPFPLGLHMSRSETPSLRYELNNRAASDLQSPSLAVVRRYDTVAEQRGALWKWALPRRMNLSFTAQQNKDTVNRQYDFGEDRDIFVDFVTIRPDDAALVHPVVVRNEIADDTVLLFINQILVDTLSAGDTVILTLDKGSHDAEFVPLRLNSFRATVLVRGDMQWQIVHSAPPGSKDVSRSTDTFRSTFKAGGDGAFQDEAFFVYDKVQEDVQRLDSKLSTFNNLANYTPSLSTRVDFLTTFTRNETNIRDVSSQSSEAFTHQTTGRYRRQRGINLQGSHAFARTSTRTDVTDVTSNTNTLMGNVTMPTGFHAHEVAARVSATYVNDNLRYRSEQYTSELDNRLVWQSVGVRWLPRYILKYTSGARENPDGSTNEFESHAILGGEVFNVGVIGLLKFKGDYSWRRRETDTSVGTKSTYLGEVGITSRTMKGARIGFNTSHELQTFSRPDVVAPADGGIVLRPLDDQVRHTYRVDLQTAISSVFTAGGNIMLLTTNDTRLRRIVASLSARIPRVNLPIRSSLIDENRDLIGLPTQKLFEIQTRASLTVRRVRVVLSHTYSRDRQLTEEYRYQQLLAKVTRNFEVW